MDHIYALCSNENSDMVGRVAMLLWCTWYNRNDKIWNDNVQMSSPVGRQAFDVVFIGYGKTSSELCYRDSNGQFMASMTQ
ncbi:hypothetical protein A2U01_0037277 [Trifolium medium]|uniref:Uncharacterized protein n=1 Tax=Trifolium medium TaxID=97028 RepID=A0A392PXU9_9FABA|nr:hypothetical protein [Trifolium medium]